MARPARVRVYDTRIATLFTPGGQAYDNAMDDARAIKGIAVTRAPGRTGTLKRLHRITSTGSRPFHTLVGVINTTSYALYVHDGTDGPITSNTPDKPLRMRPSPHSYFPVPTLHESVDGQNANPWLADAADAVLLPKYRVRARRY